MTKPRLLSRGVFTFFKDYASWKRAFFATIKQTKLPIFLRIAGYVVLFILVDQILKYFNYEPDFLATLIVVSILLFVVRFGFTLIQEKNKK